MFFNTGSPSSPTNVAATGSGTIVFSCGCSAQAGTMPFSPGGAFTVPQSAPATPAAPSPTYTIVPSRNYILVAQQGNGAQAWTMQFAGNTPAHNVALTSTEPNSSAVNAGFDTYTTAAALYVFQESATTNDLAFDQWNLTTVNAWATSMRSGSQNTAEQTLLSDILTAETSNQSLYPGNVSWAQAGSNSTIANDIANVHNSADPALPTPCPNGCSGTPTP